MVLFISTLANLYRHSNFFTCIHELETRKSVLSIFLSREPILVMDSGPEDNTRQLHFSAFDMLSKDTSLRDKLEANTTYFRKGMEDAGFDLVGADAAIVPVMLYDAKLSQDMANELLEEGIYVIGFFYPVVPKEKARIRVQLSAAHSIEHIDKAIAAFTKVGKKLNVI